MCTRTNKLAHESQLVSLIIRYALGCLLMGAIIEMDSMLCVAREASISDDPRQDPSTTYRDSLDGQPLAASDKHFKLSSDGDIKRLSTRATMLKVGNRQASPRNNTNQTKTYDWPFGDTRSPTSLSSPVIGVSSLKRESHANQDMPRKLDTTEPESISKDEPNYDAQMLNLEQFSARASAQANNETNVANASQPDHFGVALTHLIGHSERPDPTNDTWHGGSSSASAKKSSRSIKSKAWNHNEPQMADDDLIMSSIDHDIGRDTLRAAESEQKFDQDSDCALILKRTYILRTTNEVGHNRGTGDEWGEKFVFDDTDPDDEAETKKRAKGEGNGAKAGKRKRIHKTDLCILHSDVDKAVENAKHKMKFEPPKDLNSLDISDSSVALVGELNFLASSLLVKQFDLSPDEILNALPMIDMSASKFFWKDLCPRHVRPMICIKSRYRTFTGHCNNLRHPSWGAAKTPYARYLPPDYADGLGEPRASRVDGRPLPSARLISSIVHVDSDEPSHDHSILFADWGQLLNHDVTRVAVGKVPSSDPLYSKFKVKCLKFDRSLPAIRPKCLLGPRSPFNLITSSVDASFVYGSSKAEAANLRTFEAGKMRVWNYFEGKWKPLLPPKRQQPDDECLGRPKDLYCFMAGDVRVNEQTHLTVLHTIYVREHNRLAKLLGQMNLDWDDDRIYHETRHIVAASVQHVMVNEFLPLLLGPKLMAEYQLGPVGAGGEPQSASPDKGAKLFWSGYDPSVTISTGAAFAAAAFRYGHSQIEGLIKRMDPKSGSLISKELLRFLLKRPFVLYEPGAIDQLLMGMLLTAAEQTDPFVSEEVSGHLFQPPKAKFGHDLAAINIQRGRDKGVPGYNDWREWCGLARAKSFEDLEPLLMNRTAWQFERIYKHVDDIDLWSAGISERKLPGSAVGPTLACIIARQFVNFKRGDRFWYENPNQPSSFTSEQLREIKKVKLAKILCTNSDDIQMIQPWAMRLPHPIYNARVPCESLPSINLKYWDSSNLEIGFD